MTQKQWNIIEETLSALTVQEKLELVARLVRSIQTELGPARTHAGEQLERLGELRRKLASMPTATVSDGPKANLAGEEPPPLGPD